ILPPVFSQIEKVIMPTPVPTPSPTPYIPPEIPKEVEVSKEQKTAYDRIMASAKKEEISAGLAIGINLFGVINPLFDCLSEYSNCKNSDIRNRKHCCN
ncbi:MAG: hypothetical protein UIM25_06360, partial [Bacteroidales bacterium]|nr:hypothetical protein [Bacteroidales bacterium]